MNLELFQNPVEIQECITSKLKVIDSQINELNEQVRSLKEVRLETFKTSYFQCGTIRYRGFIGCGQYMPIKDIPLIQRHWYTSPRGCSGGDYWNIGALEAQCPLCNHRTEIKEDSPYMTYKKLFKSITNEYKD